MYTDDFIEYLRKEKRMANNSCDAYRRDVSEFVSFEAARGITDVTQSSSTEMVAWLHQLKEKGRSASTVNRKVASVRAFYRYLMEKGFVSSDPTSGIRSPKIERKEIEYLTIQEIDRLLESPDDSVRGVRDRAILEVLYATGIRVSELIDMDLDSINLRMGFVTCDGEGSRARIIPLGRPARAALENYISDARVQLVRDRTDEQALFVNQYGRRITRQGLWKILKDYGEKAQLEHSLTPHTLRNSFAVHMLQNGADLKSLQELMGHDDITATQVYLSATKSRLKDVYDRAHPRA
ncbi:MAG: tyrosine recombinase [Firmicutes bacterium]|nr:tyrosine recombinase [Bacillota bacterium]